MVSKLLGGVDPTLGGIFDQNQQQQRAQAIGRTASMMKLIPDPVAREVFGRAQLDQFGPGTYEEGLAQAYPEGVAQALPSSVGGLQYTGPSIADKGLLGVLASPGPAPTPQAPGTAPMADSPWNPFNMLLGNDNFASNYLRQKGR